MTRSKWGQPARWPGSHDPSYERVLTQAIQSKHLVSFTAKDCVRVAEPHVLGWHGGELHVLTFQVGGLSNSGGLPEWRRFRVADIDDLAVSARTFPGARPTKRISHSSFDRVLEAVDGGVWLPGGR